jgi:hypothetical protein
MEFEKSIHDIIDQMRESGKYRSLLWAGGFKNQKLHKHSDVDLYAITPQDLPQHWLMERIAGRGKNLTRVLKAPECPDDVKSLIRKLLSSPETDEMVDAAVQLCQRTFELTGGPVNENNGGIPR